MLRLTSQQFHVLNRLLAVGIVAVRTNGWRHHEQTIRDAQRLLDRCEVEDLAIDLPAILIGHKEAA